MAISILPTFGASSPDASASPVQEHARYVGALGCESSMCHGGASPMRCQYAIWNRMDPHAGAYASLVSAYGGNIAHAAGVSTPTTDARCVYCHAPLAMPRTELASTADVTEGVTCEVCHNSAAAWLRSHTRPDFTYADRVNAGLRDLRDTYVRAVTCAKCHQAVQPDTASKDVANPLGYALVSKYGHPALTFELDGQTASEPRHWTEKESWFGAKAWLVGQFVALRDITKMAGQTADKDDLATLASQQQALLWVLEQVPNVAKVDSSTESGTGLVLWSEGNAHAISNGAWSNALSRQTLAALAGTSESFRDAKVSPADQAARAQRLVLALDRLLKSTHPTPAVNPLRPPDEQKPTPPVPGDAELGDLFTQAAKNAKAFDAAKFAEALKKFDDIISNKP